MTNLLALVAQGLRARGSKLPAQEAISAVTKEIMRAVASGERVDLRGFGSFSSDAHHREVRFEPGKRFRTLAAGIDVAHAITTPGEPPVRDQPPTSEAFLKRPRRTARPKPTGPPPKGTENEEAP
ncbi:HU family DNA-binding protein [Streptomyces sp. NPDC021622]|uniref:HU family DNA-binding protein n=1 Tax=Streptomyces sp. NPDC021622 TaxID=3155013 RepID=UPI0033D001ED